jgi:hypothetical protein
MRFFNSLSSKSLLMAATVALALGSGCAKQASTGAGAGNPSADADHAQQLQALETKRENYEKQIKGMDATQLAATLATDSQKGREPFNSTAYREMITRGDTGATTLKPLLTHEDRSSLLGLLALRQLSPAQYHSLSPGFRVNVLVGSLGDSKFFNTWGVPNFYWNDAAKAIVDEGNAAVEPLVRLLKDTRPAPVFGSEGAAVNAQFHFRVCDYALALLNEIRNQKAALPADVAARDKLIAESAAKKP